MRFLIHYHMIDIFQSMKNILHILSICRKWFRSSVLLAHLIKQNLIFKINWKLKSSLTEGKDTCVPIPLHERLWFIYFHIPLLQITWSTSRVHVPVYIMIFVLVIAYPCMQTVFVNLRLLTAISRHKCNGWIR